jgi:hypothetical protein
MRSEAMGQQAAADTPLFTIDAMPGYLLSFFSFTATSLF